MSNIAPVIIAGIFSLIEKAMDLIEVLKQEDVTPEQSAELNAKINATIPKDSDPEKVTLEEALTLIAARAAKGPAKKKTAKKAPAKKAATKKASAKSPAKKAVRKSTKSSTKSKETADKAAS